MEKENKSKGNTMPNELTIQTLETLDEVIAESWKLIRRSNNDSAPLLDVILRAVQLKLSVVESADILHLDGEPANEDMCPV